METFKKYVTCIMAFFISFTFVTLCQIHTFTSSVLFSKNKKLWNERKEDFLYIWLLQRITLNQKRQKISSQTQSQFQTHMYIYTLILTKQQNYDIFVQILHSYLRYTDRLLDLFFLLLAEILSELHEKPRRKD